MRGTLRKKAVLLIALVLSIGMLACGCTDSAGQGTLKVGVRDDIMNFGYLNETTGKYYGL